MELWNGARAGLEGACSDYGADDAFPISDIDDILPGLLETRSDVYYAMGYYQEFDQRMLNWVNKLRTRSRAGVNSPAQFVALDHVLHDMRLYKSRAEIKTMTWPQLRELARDQDHVPRNGNQRFGPPARHGRLPSRDQRVRN